MPEEHSASAALSNAGQDSDRLAYSVAEAARRLDVSRMTLYREIAAGRLAAIRIRDRLVIPRTALERLVEDASLAAVRARPGGDADAPGVGAAPAAWRASPRGLSAVHQPRRPTPRRRPGRRRRRRS